MTVKEFLRNIPKLTVLVERKKVQIAQMESSLIYKGVSQGDGGSFGSGDTDRRNKALCNWVALMDELNKQIDTLVATKRQGIMMIDSLMDAKQIDVFYRRYLEDMKWCDIAKELGVSMQWVHELHKRGLRRIHKNYPEFD